MSFDELLITGYCGDKSRFTVNVEPGCATVVLTRTNAQGETVVDSTWKQATGAFTALREVLDGLVAVSPADSS
ncbi:MAG TPA: hypothetical protein VFC19_29625 [Candidatus Limnocylindrales bacterium]|nr:hypothetical protein [Candidatus Limnocylindrales bacterium]